MKNYFATILLISLSICTSAQKLTTLHEVVTTDYKNDGQAIIYGNFIQRLGFSSGGFTQFIRIANIETKEISQFEVKPMFKSAKENKFCHFIKPGTYVILNYFWAQGKWYGAKIFTEPIFKNIDSTDSLKEKINSGQLTRNDLKQYTFTVTENSLNYLGTWHFDKGLVTFTDDKNLLDAVMIAKFKNIDFSLARITLPN